MVFTAPWAVLVSDQARWVLLLRLLQIPMPSVLAPVFLLAASVSLGIAVALMPIHAALLTIPLIQRRWREAVLAALPAGAVTALVWIRLDGGGGVDRGRRYRGSGPGLYPTVTPQRGVVHAHGQWRPRSRVLSDRSDQPRETFRLRCYR